MTATEIILALGGRNRVAEITGAKRNAVTQWYKAGIPAKFWFALLEEAERIGASNVTISALRGSHRSSRLQEEPVTDAVAA